MTKRINESQIVKNVNVNDNYIRLQSYLQNPYIVVKKDNFSIYKPITNFLRYLGLTTVRKEFYFKISKFRSNLSKI